MSDVIKPRPGMNVSIKVGGDSLPQGGDVGDVLTKTESGAEWQKPTGGVTTVNGVGPDENGNVTVEIPEIEVPEVDLSGVVKSVNGAVPDENGNVTIEVSSDVSIDGGEVIDMLIDLNALPAVVDSDGAIYTDESGAILMM